MTISPDAQKRNYDIKLIKNVTMLSKCPKRNDAVQIFNKG